MNHALILNLGIILVIICGLIATANPLFIFGLMMLQEMPYGLLAQRKDDDEEDDDDEPQPVGFTQIVK